MVRRFLKVTVLVLAPLALTGGTVVTNGCAYLAKSPQNRCCKVCDVGKPCGDDCIPESEVCQVGQGCACSSS